MSATRRLVTTYDYRDETGTLLYQVLRYEPKEFRQRRPDGGGGWVWNLGNVRRVLYRLPELVAADGETPIFVVEGEKDADRLASLDLVATTCPMGAGKWRPEFTPLLSGRTVVILPDNDEPGRIHARLVALVLKPVARSARVVQLPGLPPKGDVSDWLDAGRSRTELLYQCFAAPAANGREGEAPAEPRTPARPEPRPPVTDSAAVAYRPFPLAALPSVVHDYVAQAAAALGCDPAYVALPALAALAGVVGTSRTVRLKASWDDPINFSITRTRPSTP